MAFYLVAIAFATFLCMLTWYLLASASRKPVFLGGRAKKFQKILKAVSENTGAYHATPWSYGGHLHTIFAHFLRTRPKVTYETEYLTTPDSGRLRLDWARGGPRDARNVVLILPGLTGTSREAYVRHFVKLALDLGHDALVMNYRGSFEPVSTYRFNCAANTDDLQLVLAHLKNTQTPHSKICAVGVSLGGIILSNYLVKLKAPSLLSAGFVVSIPWDLSEAASSLEKPVTWLLFNFYLTRKLRYYYQLSVAKLRSHGVVIPDDVVRRAAKSSCIREFDDAVIAPMFGYRDVNAYYQDASVLLKPFETVTTPLLCLNAMDDPFSPGHQIPTDRVAQCANVAMILTNTGGHVGFLEGLLPTGGGYMCRVYEEFVKAVFEHL